MGPKLVLGFIIDMKEFDIEKVNEYLNQKLVFDTIIDVKKIIDKGEDGGVYEIFLDLGKDKKKVIVSYNTFSDYLVIDLSFSIKPIFIGEDLINNEDYKYGVYPYDICNYLYPLCKDIKKELKGVILVWLGEEVEYYDIIDENLNLKDKDIYKWLYCLDYDKNFIKPS